MPSFRSSRSPTLIAYAKKNPGKLSYGTSGVGSPHHLSGELLRQKTGIDITHIPYKGGGAAVNDLLGGHIGMAFLSLSAAVPHMNTGKIRIVAVVEKTRYAALPEIPTVGETVPGFEMSSWVGVFAPAGTPPDIIAKLNDAMAKVLKADAVKEKLANLGLVVQAGTPEELAETVKDGLKVRGELVKAAGIQPESDSVCETFPPAGRGSASGGVRAAPAGAARRRREGLRAHPEELSRSVRRAAPARAVEAAGRQGRRGAAADHRGAEDRAGVA